MAEILRFGTVGDAAESEDRVDRVAISTASCAVGGRPLTFWSNDGFATRSEAVRLMTGREAADRAAVAPNEVEASATKTAGNFLSSVILVSAVQSRKLIQTHPVLRYSFVLPASCANELL